MRFLPFVLPLLLCFLAGSCSHNQSLDDPITLEELTVEIHGTSREVAYTNKEAGSYYTETNGEHRSAWQGWYIMANEVMEDYRIGIDGRDLLKSDAAIAFVSPHQVHRAYPSGIQETVTLLDSVDALVVQLEKIRGVNVSIRPTFSDSREMGDYVVRFREGVLLIARQRHLVRNSRENYPVWIGVTFSQPGEPDSIALGGLFDRGFSPAGIVSGTKSSTTIILVAGDTEEATIREAQRIAGEYELLIEERKDRMERLLNHAFLRTDNERFDKAVHWAIVSMDALIMNQTKRGIYAGLPWFNNYWGRDSFIALPGATLVTGKFAEAKEILRSFAEWQEKDPKNPNYGRIPNLVTTTSIAYNTADGTPRFIIALEEYLKYSGDTTFARELYPVVQRAIEGTQKYHMDRSLFLTHGDPETWMDAVGPAGPWSPRGNRANDIQALWIRQLQCSRRIAALLNDSKDEYRWAQIESVAAANFKRIFVDPGQALIYDHLNADGSVDSQMRPNQLFALGFLSDSLGARVLQKMTQTLVYRYGVASLSQDDPNFHPYHHYEPFYVQDAAYHNGIVWTWLNGAWIDVTAKSGYQNLAFELTENMVHQILERGAVGTLSELVDAVPRPGETEPRLSGTFSQAWSLAEFIRNVYQTYLGVEVNGDTLEIHSRLPSALHEAKFNVWSGNSATRITVHSSDERGEIEIDGSENTERDASFARVSWQFADGEVQGDLDVSCAANVKPTHILFTKKSATIESDEGLKEIPQEARSIRPFGSVSFTVPTVRPDLSALKTPSHKLLSNAEIIVRNPQASVICDVSDPAGDDNGNGHYVYPGTPNLKPGSLDIRRFSVAEDARDYYFRLQFENLSNPGWHPEYGFQLTYVAIAIDQDGRKGSGQRSVGMNSNFTLDDEHGFERVIYVGGGFSVANGKGEVLAEYLPVSGDDLHPLGNVGTKSIEFAIPKEYLGEPPGAWRYTVLIGAQDDHGGAGIGDFRDVKSTVGEWWGGGRKNKGDSNVYDVLEDR